MTGNAALSDVLSSASYTFNIFAVPNVMSAALVLFACTVALWHTRGNRAGQLFVILGLTGFLWLGTRAMVYSSARLDVAEWWSILYVAALPVAPAVLYHLSTEMLQITRERMKLLWCNWLITCVLIALQLRFGALSDGAIKLSIGYVAQTSMLGKVATLWLFLVCVFGMAETAIAWLGAPAKSLLKQRLRLMLIGVSLVLATGLDGIASSGNDVYQPGWLFVTSAVMVLWYMMRYSRLIDATPEFSTSRVINRLTTATLVIEREGKIRAANPAAEKLSVAPAKALMGMSISEAMPNLISPRLLQKLRETGQRYTEEVTRQSPSSGKQDELQLTISPLDNNAETNPGFVVSLSDISRLKHAEKELRHLSLQDSLTGLANRRFFMQELERCFARYIRNNTAAFTLVFIDLDKFKPINDKFGHQMGDALLKAVAERLKSIVRESDYCARLGGDEFALLATDSKTTEDAEALTDRLRAVFMEPISINGERVQISASIGCIQPNFQQHRNHEQLLHAADQAMYCEKKLQTIDYQPGASSPVH